MRAVCPSSILSRSKTTAPAPPQEPAREPEVLSAVLPTVHTDDLPDLLLNRKPRVTREAEDRFKQIRKERGDQYHKLRPPR